MSATNNYPYHNRMAHGVCHPRPGESRSRGFFLWILRDEIRTSLQAVVVANTVDPDLRHHIARQARQVREESLDILMGPWCQSRAKRLAEADPLTLADVEDSLAAARELGASLAVRLAARWGADPEEILRVSEAARGGDVRDLYLLTRFHSAGVAGGAL